ncbi:uroporphyrinogen decarboxylase [Marinivivus vitaminiproducens]|uniref:uroporphyrinogen decarboxylase n=1 Tax=Marinivivus vitaminiproducens TaxID=3035935 RepID=UPI0027A004F4|nr:uroporphyrinogen decarboxylase [Geminicoccaceae bacterium SCSIO 64248]
MELRLVNKTAANEGHAKPLLAALAGQAARRPPVWLMRQAGRYLPEYREVRAAAGSFLDLCYTPELAAEVTLQPIRRFGFDAAILFSDILVVPDALGCDVRYVEGEGPQMTPIRDAPGVERLASGGVTEHLQPVYETVRRLAAALPADVALIGFAGAPWTVCAYMVEGHGSREFQEARRFARAAPDVFGRLIDTVTQATVAHLSAQITAGAEAVQIFDSWAGVLPESEFLRWCQAPVRRIVAELRQIHPRVPVIAFPRGCGALYPDYVRDVGCAGLGLDTAVPLRWIRAHVPDTVCLQGNVDPVLLLQGGPALAAEVERTVEALSGRPHIVNLGHGVLPPTDPAHVQMLIDAVRGP